MSGQPERGGRCMMQWDGRELTNQVSEDLQRFLGGKHRLLLALGR
jgi:hypothetical protein